MTINIEEMATFCKKKGFVYPSAEIYGGMAGFFDFGPLGVELKNNLIKNWWKIFVQDSDNVVGIDGAIISPAKVWQASGHVDSFNDPMVFCKKHQQQFRADNLLAEILKIDTDGLSKEQLLNLIINNKTNIKKAGYELEENITEFNLMFATQVGIGKDNLGYLRGETAQLIFTAFKNVVDTSRVKLPFGIAQVGKAFRNEISPREFLFRVREFEQMEMEFFVHPDKVNDCELIDELLNLELNVISAKQQKDKKSHSKIKVKDLLKLKINKWHAYWLVRQYQWFLSLGMNPDHLRVREHLPEELAHYAKACFDLEYQFPMGWREIYGNADRGQYDLNQHQKFSGKKLEYFDEEKQEKVVPYVASEPSQGVGRAFLAILFDAYHTRKDEQCKEVVVLKLSPKLAPYLCGIFPLVKNKPEIVKKAEEVQQLLKPFYACFYDESASIGRRYARADEIGIPFGLTIDFDSLNDNCVTIRDRNTAKQERVSISKLKDRLEELYYC